MIIKQIDDNTRIVEGRSFLGFYSNTVRLQRKKRFGWKTTSWLYTHQRQTVQKYYEWFLWDEKNRNNSMGKKQFTR